MASRAPVDSHPVKDCQQLAPASGYGTSNSMTEMKKITAFVPASLLASAQEETGEGISETLRIGLQKLALQRFYRGMRELRGKVQIDIDIDALREDKEYDGSGNVIR